MNMLKLFSVGDEIFGYCNGLFGRDSYDNKVCVMVTPKYAVFQNEDGVGELLNYSEDLSDLVEEWKVEEVEEDLEDD